MLLIVALCFIEYHIVYAQSEQQLVTEETGHAVIPAETESGGEQTEFQFSGANQLNLTGLIAKTAGYFLLIVALIFATVFLLKRFVYNRKSISGPGKAIQVISSTYVGPKKSLMLVEVAGRMLVISVTDTTMNLIAELKKEELEQYGNRPDSENSDPTEIGSQFGDIFSKLLKRPK